MTTSPAKTFREFKHLPILSPSENLRKKIIPKLFFATARTKTTNLGNVGKAVVRTETAVSTETSSKELAKIGRQGKEKRLVEISEDWRTGKADRGWIIQEQNHAKREGRGMSGSKVLRNPPGKVLAHKPGKEAAKGFDYSHADLQEIELHKTQHKYDNFGKKNK